MVTYFKILLLTLISLISTVCYAKSSLGDVAGSLSGGATIISEILIAACVVVGICLLGTAVTHYQIHRNNPKLVPLMTPLLYLILGLLLSCLPLLLEYWGDNDSAPNSYPETTLRQYSIDDPLD